jgi:hypothetical protein
MRRSRSSSGLLQDPREAQDDYDDNDHDEHPEDGAEFGCAGEEGMHVRNDTDGRGCLVRDSLEILDELREAIRHEAEAARRDRDELEGWQIASMRERFEENEAKTLREFIQDVRLGIRDLSELEDICGR